MGLIQSVKTAVIKAGVKSYLNKLRQVDHGTTVAGTIASVLLASQVVSLDKIIGGTPVEQVVEGGKALAILTFWLVMKMIGKPVAIDTVIQEAAEAAEAEKQK
jgi:hypothetical protein